MPKSHGEPIGVELLKLFQRQLAHAGHDHAGQQVDRIPDAVPGRQAPEDGRQRHQQSADEAASKPGRTAAASCPVPQRHQAATTPKRNCDTMNQGQSTSLLQHRIDESHQPKLTPVHSSGISSPPQASGLGNRGSVGSSTP